MDPENSQDGASRPAIYRVKKYWWAIAAAILLVLLIGVARFRANAKANALRAGANAPLAVTVARVATADVPITIDALGTVTPLATVTVHPQINGPITKINFTEGQMLKAGALLAEIDARPFKAAVDQAKGQLDRDTALLANAKIDLARYKTLLAEDSVSEQQYATQQATVNQDEGTVAADVANLEAAQLSLDYCRITTPVAGLVGLRQVDVGNLVQANSSEIVVVTQMQPMSVLFTVPEDSLAASCNSCGPGRSWRSMPTTAVSPTRLQVVCCRMLTTRLTRLPARSNCGQCLTMPSLSCFRTSSSTSTCCSTLYTMRSSFPAPASSKALPAATSTLPMPITR